MPVQVNKAEKVKEEEEQKKKTKKNLRA